MPIRMPIQVPMQVPMQAPMQAPMSRYHAPMAKLMIIKTGAAPHPIATRFGDFEDWFIAAMALSHHAVRIIDVSRGHALPEVAHSPEAVLVTGSPAMVSHRLAWSEKTAAWLVRAHAAGLPMIGVCYGHQLLAHALGGQVGPNPAGRRMGSRAVMIEQADDLLLGCLAPRTTMQVTHVESVLSVPAGARVIAHSPGDPHHALHFGALTWGVQFHPEFTTDIMAAYIELRADALNQAGQDPVRLLGELSEAPDGAPLLRRFLQLAAGGKLVSDQLAAG